MSKTAVSQQNVTTSNIPDWAKADAQHMLGQTRALTDISQNPWQQYQGQRFAGINPLQQQYMTGVSQMGPSAEGQFGAALTGMAGLGSLNTGAFGNAQAQQYMSPYLQNVLDVQKNEAVRDYGRQLPTLGAGIAAHGGLGGTRAAVMQSEGMRNLQNNLQGIQAKGLQTGYENAQAQFNADQNRQLQGYGQSIQAGQALGQLGQGLFDQNLQGLNAQRVAGADLNAMEQQQLSAQYQDFLDQQNYPYKQLGFFSDVLHGLPTTESSTTYRAAPNTTGLFANAASSGLANLFFNKSPTSTGG